MLPDLVTERLRLVPLTEADLDRLHDLLTQPGVRRYLCDDAVLERAQVERLRQEAAGYEPEGLGLWSVLTAQGTWIGIIGLQPVSGEAARAFADFAGAVEPMVALRPEAWGRGYAEEALRRAADYAFLDLRQGRLVALVDEPNVRSRGLLERVGFGVVGTGPGPKFPLRAYSLASPKRRLDSGGAGG
jgi:ribosomal-protein-alanine N-acetyltransferase